MLSGNVTLNLTTVHALVRWRHAEPHPVLATTPAWYDEQTRRAMDRHALGELDHNGLLRDGRPVADLEAVVGVLVRPDREHYGWITTTVDGRPFRYGVLAAATHQEAVLAVRNNETDVTVLAAIRPEELTRAFLAQLPAVPPAAGRLVSAPYQEFLATVDPAEDGFAGFGTRQSPEVRTIRAVLDRPRTGGGSLYTAGRTSAVGSRQRADQPLNYVDTTTGRWLTQLDLTANGTLAVLRPGSVDLVAEYLTHAANDASAHLTR
ncbi:ESX secretion-associated protein EspG [Actinophytocola xanthii]|uniref:ESX secretion-associated protein EspG n=1 Tax=Actinophytocola xanthii TaxID=1912961 RepID=A0A1Q8CAA3_9PSEU|nr:ESX secretion-associated protein EspG [Actinophytocola xanthii]OLF11262.1 hypothetical protein BU204_30770 [Actinophytocola xanthii]